ncbi:flagellar protein FliT [Chromobacterium violaceum]|uniref:flagellar protein FliT n=1 Tax=Chromobacterium violaceum TaxID=536 RepID=UPI0009DAFE62|nr:flagellar protein FliT [Chromobacterium violaceum]
MTSQTARSALAELIEQLEPLTRELLEAANLRDRPRFSSLYGRSEAHVQQLLKTLEQEGRDQLSDEQREVLHRVLIVREETQRQLANWAGQVKDELRTLSQSSKLNRQYKG